ncbi:hypothetical protein CKO09_00775 [Chromatium weissei]|nr:hypothetical protein [Chromatium weissei]
MTDALQQQFLSTYEADIIAWATEQARLLREGQFAQLDIAHLIEEIEDVGKRERHEFASCMAVLLAHLLKWQYQPARQSTSWQRTIKEQRNAIALCIKETPSLKTSFDDSDWWAGVWSDAVARAAEKTGLDVFPETCVWSTAAILDSAWLPTN